VFAEAGDEKPTTLPASDIHSDLHFTFYSTTIHVKKGLQWMRFKFNFLGFKAFKEHIRNITKV
jgi:hypothetical protein